MGDRGRVHASGSGEHADTSESLQVCDPAIQRSSERRMSTEVVAAVVATDARADSPPPDERLGGKRAGSCPGLPSSPPPSPPPSAVRDSHTAPARRPWMTTSRFVSETEAPWTQPHFYLSNFPFWPTTTTLGASSREQSRADIRKAWTDESVGKQARTNAKRSSSERIPASVRPALQQRNEDLRPP